MEPSPSKPRDANAELQALIDQTKTLEEKKTRQISEIVAATGADALDIETLAGALLALVESGDASAIQGSLCPAFARNGRSIRQRTAFSPRREAAPRG